MAQANPPADAKAYIRACEWRTRYRVQPRMTFLRRIPLAFGLVLSAVHGGLGCGDSSSPSDGDAGTGDASVDSAIDATTDSPTDAIPKADAIPDIFDSGIGDFDVKFCDLIHPCCEAAGYGDIAKCRQAVHDWGPRYDSVKTAKCVEELLAAKDNPDFCAKRTTYAPTCLDLYRHYIPAGDECSPSEACARPPSGYAFCESPVPSDGGPTTRYCEQIERGKEGDACDAVVSDTGFSSFYYIGTKLDRTHPSVVGCWKQDGLFCKPAGAHGVCAKSGDVGAACNGFTYWECANGLYCPPSTSGGRTCSVLPASGESCTSDCASGAYCDKATGASTGTCKPLVDAGGACTSGAVCLSGICELGNKCGPKVDYELKFHCGY